jgi:hypothetical protein
MDMVPVMDTAIAVGLELPSYSAGSLAPAITMAPSMESWDLRLGEQFGPTTATVDTKVDLEADLHFLGFEIDWDDAHAVS